MTGELAWEKAYTETEAERCARLMREHADGETFVSLAREQRAENTPAIRGDFGGETAEERVARLMREHADGETIPQMLERYRNSDERPAPAGEPGPEHYDAGL